MRAADHLRLEEAARLAAVHPSTIRAWVRAGWFEPQAPTMSRRVLRLLGSAKRALKGTPGARPAWQAFARLLRALAPGRTPDELHRALGGRALVRFTRRGPWSLLDREGVGARLVEVAAADRDGRCVWLTDL